MDRPGVDLARYDQAWFDRGRPWWVILLWGCAERCLLHPSPHLFFAWRRFVYRCFGARIGRGVRLARSVRCKYPWRVVIGDHAWIGEQVDLYSLERIEIGPHAVVSQYAVLCTGSHDPADPAFGLQVAPIIIGPSAWVCLGATVLKGVTVGEGAVVGSRALLTRDAQPWTIYRGVPAQAAGRRELRSV